MTNHNLENFMKLASVGNKRDAYYANAYQEISSGKKVSWNWSAALASSTWMVYRKMYLYSILAYFGIILFLAATVTPIIAFIDLKSIATIDLIIRIIILCGCFITPFVLLSLFSNWLYVRHIHKKIDKNYHLSTLKNTDRATLWILLIINVLSPIIEIVKTKAGIVPSSFFDMLFLIVLVSTPVISILITIVSDKQKVAKAIAEQQSGISQS